MQDKLSGIENTSAVTERRACPRLRVTSLIYIDIGNVNGGIVTSLSESGLALTAAATLANAQFGDGPLRMRIQFPGTPEAIEASGEIVWTSPSGKEARVRFVEIGETAREQIRGWISDQVSSNGLRPNSPQLPKMQLPSSRRGKRRGTRFSFADVASSRVDAESETGVEDSPEIRGQPEELPPLEAGSGIFRDGAEVVASAFESPAFVEDQTRNIDTPQIEHTTPDEQLRQQANPAIPERRQHARRQILLFTYAVLGEDNGGLVFNLGEGGLALTAAAALQEHHFSKIRVRFPDSSDWFETNGCLAWKSDSGKEAGVEFLNLPADVRTRIAEWASQAELSRDLASRNEDEAGPQELPSFMEPEFSPTELIEIPASFEEQPFEDQVSENRFEEPTRTPAAALFKTGIKGILERASVKRRVAKIKPPRLAEPSAKPPTRVASKVLSIAAGFALAIGGWMFFQRTSLNEASGIVAQNLPNTQPSHEPLQAKAPDHAKPGVGGSKAIADAPIQLGKNPNETAATHNGISTPPLRQIEKAPTPDTPKTAATTANFGSERTSKENSQTKDALKHMPVEISPPPSSDQAHRPAAPTQRSQETKSTQAPASAPAPSLESKSSENKPAESKPAESKPVQIAQAFPAQNKELNAASLLPTANPSQPAAAPPVDLEKEISPVAPKQPEPILARTPVVTVSFDPFPSIRMPTAEKSKKSHQGKSLQMGRLLSRVDPAYPDEAKQQGIEGTVRLHAIFNRDGGVQSLISASGPPLLVPAAMNAVRQWRYSQTILGGQAMETEEDVTVLFRLANSAAN